MGEVELFSAHKPDWMLVPKEEEAEFCKSEDIKPIDELPKTFTCPPMLELVQRKEMEARGDSVPDILEIPFVHERPNWEIKRHLV